MAKRIADKELTDRNWDQEDEGEEAGTFSVASEDVLKNRAIKKAKRRNVGSEVTLVCQVDLERRDCGAASGGSAPTAFSGFGNGGGFKGLGGLTNGNSIAPSFGGFSSPAAPPTATSSTAAPPTATPRPPVTSQLNRPMVGSDPGSELGSGSGSGSNREYSRQLTALNCSVRDWITKHVNDNPLCDLNPIFRDYERHLASIERQYGAGSADGGSEEKKLPSTAAAPAASSSSSSSSSGSRSSSPQLRLLYSPSVKNTTEDSTRDKSAAAPLVPASRLTSGRRRDGDEESEEPPRPEIREVKEDDAFYSKKKHPAEHHGAVVHAVLSVGKQRDGGLRPQPGLDDKNPSSPVPLLIRVKTAEDADELHKTLEEKKG
ncbi:Nuclear pore complex protein [Collichthys lucidus]|uniref:Nuclear pore complex protein n=1 Tax=Collichthys lucidus TaxID=240159 RepID=A0A4U5VPG6_COLLU|nr:Nuclear pore complex protein [Collichthys lucidus]